MAEFPKTRGDLIKQGYAFISPQTCRGESCGQNIEFWRTPTGSRIPLNKMADDPQERVMPHWATCPNRKQFRKRGDKK